MRSIRRIGSILGTLTLLAPAAAFAQTGQTAQIPLQFDFLDPGARSLGLGSAFVAVADDATSAFTNPAGLTQLAKPEVSAELRYRNLTTPFLSGGRLSGTVTGNGIDTVAGPTYSTSTDSAFRPYFLSVVYPKNRWSFSGYRHELVLQNNSFLSQGPFEQVTLDGAILNNQRLAGLDGTREIAVTNYGAAVGYRVSPRLSVGADLAIYHFDLTSNFGAVTFPGSSLFAAVDPTTLGTGSTTTQTGSGTSVGVNAGVLVNVNPKLRAGFVFRQGVSFDFTQTSAVPGLSTTTETGQFRTPYVIGAGVRAQANDALMIAVDYDRVAYSRLTTDFITFQVDPDERARVNIGDANELHVGVEYTLVNVAHTPSIRGGIWFDPDHAVQYTSDGTNSTDDIRLKATFPGGESVWHYSVGAGLPLSPRYEVNVGADLTSARRYVSASIVARFGK